MVCITYQKWLIYCKFHSSVNSDKLFGFWNSSHAVLEITVLRKQKRKYRSQVFRGKLALVDLAGRYKCFLYAIISNFERFHCKIYKLCCSERASETNSDGQKLRDGANINRSLLALANCINALGKQHKKGLAYVPYRNR